MDIELQLAPGPEGIPGQGDALVSKDILDREDILRLKTAQRPRDVESMAAEFAARVQRAPQFCRFLKFEKLNLMNPLCPAT
jgi:hypothetical protein